MAIPTLQSITLPLLRLAADGDERTLATCVELLATAFGLTPEERLQWNPSRLARTFYNRAAWALAYLRAARLVDGTGRGRFRITERGQAVLADEPERLDITYLGRYPEFRAVRNGAPFRGQRPAAERAATGRATERATEQAAAERASTNPAGQLAPAR